MASRGWGKNKKGVLVNSEGKTALEVRLDKYAAKLKARKEKLAAKKADAKAKASIAEDSKEFTKKTVSIPVTRRISTKVKGEVLGDYVVHKVSYHNGTKWEIHHIQTGANVVHGAGLKAWKPSIYGDLSDQDAAKLAVRKLVKAKIDFPNSYIDLENAEETKKRKLNSTVRKFLES